MPDHREASVAPEPAALLSIPDALSAEAAAMLLGGNAAGLQAVQSKLAAALAGQGLSGDAAGALAGGWVNSFAAGLGAASSPDAAMAEAGRLMNGSAARMAQAMQDSAALTAEQRLASALAKGQDVTVALGGAVGNADPALAKALFAGVMDAMARPAEAADPVAALSRALGDAPPAMAPAEPVALSPAEKLNAALASGVAVTDAIKAVGADGSGAFAANLERALSSGGEVTASVAAAAERAAQGEAQARAVAVEQTGGEKLLAALASGGAEAARGALQGGNAFSGVLGDALARGDAPDAALDRSAKAQTDMASALRGAEVAQKPTDALVASLASGRDVAATVKSFAAASGLDPSAAGGFGQALGAALSSGQDAAGALGAARQDVAASSAMAAASAQGVKGDALFTALASGQNVQQVVQAAGGSAAFGAALGQALAEGRPMGQALAAARQTADLVAQTAQDSSVPVSPENQALADLASPKAGAPAEKGEPDAQVAEAADAKGAETADGEGKKAEGGEADAEKEGKDADKGEAKPGKAAGDKADAGKPDAEKADGEKPDGKDAADKPASADKPMTLDASMGKATFGAPDAGAKAAASDAGQSTAPTAASTAPVTRTTSDPFTATQKAQNPQNVTRIVETVIPDTGVIPAPVAVHAPVVADFDSAALAKALAEAEGTAAPAGFTVFHLIEAMFRPGETGGSVLGLAVVTNPGSALGVWQYSLDGTTWLAVGEVSDGAALVLSVSAMLRFLASPGASGSAPALGLRALGDSWTEGFTGAGKTLFALGDAKGLSTEVAALSLLVTAANDAPVATATAAVLTPIAEDSADPAGETVSSLFAALFSDPKDAVGGQTGDAFAGVVVVANAATAAQGVWQYWSGSAWIAVGAVSEGDGLLLAADAKLRFLPAADWNGTTPALSVRLVEDSSGALVTGTRADLSAGTGLATRYSLETVALTQVVTPANDAPVATGGSVTLGPILENSLAPSGTTVSSLFAALFSDPTDAAGAAGGDAFAGIAIVGDASASTQGAWQYWNGSAWTAVGAVSDASALVVSADGMLRFVPAAGWSGTVPALTVRLIDGSAGTLTSGGRVDLAGLGVGGTTAYSATTVTLDASVTAVNDAPVATATAVVMKPIAEDTAPAGETVSSLFAALFSDPKDAVGGHTGDAFAGVVVVANAATAAQGVWQYWSGSAWVAVGAVSEGDGLLLAADAKLRFLPAADWNGTTPALSVRLVEDSSGALVTGTRADLSGGAGLATRYSLETVALTQTVNAVSDAPVTTGGSVTLDAVTEDSANPAGATVSALFTAVFSDAKDAVPGGSKASALGGVAIVANAASTQGEWQYWNGKDWIAVGSVSEESALVVSAADKLRFVPLSDWNGEVPALTVHLIDDSAGPRSSGARINLAGDRVGGDTPYTVGTVELITRVTAVNDAPLTGGTAVTLATIAEDSANPAGESVSSLFAALFSDPRDVVPGGSSANGFAGVVVVANAATAAQGAWQYWNGSAWVAVGTLSGGDGLLLAADAKLRFLSAADWNGTTPALTVRLVDDSSGGIATGGHADLSGGAGGTTRYGATTVALTQTVTAVNDAPVATGASASMAAIAEDATAPAGQSVSSLFAAVFSDAKDAVSGGSSANAFAGIAIVADATGAQGQWQYWTGSSWVAVGTVSASSALLVKAADSLRFVPAADWNGTVPALTVRLIDGSAGAVTTGGHADLTSSGTGGTTAYSDATVALGGTVTAVNDAPHATAGTASVSTLQGVAVALAGLSVSDVDAGSNPVLVTLSVAHGRLTLDDGGLDVSIAGNDSGTLTVRGTLSAINTLLGATNGLIYTSATAGADTLTLLVDDQGGSGSGGAQTATATVAITVIPPNVSPELIDTNLDLYVAGEAAAGPESGTKGVLVSSLVGLQGASGGLQNVKDSDSGGLTGIALVGTNETYGHWWYSTDNGTNWKLVGEVSDSAALLLQSDARLYFQHNTSVPATVSGALTIRAWDQTGGTIAAAAAPGANGKIAVDTTPGSAFSAATDSVTLHPGVLIPNGTFDKGLEGWTATGGSSPSPTGDGHEAAITSTPRDTAMTQSQLEDFLDLGHGAILAAFDTPPSRPPAWGQAMKMTNPITVTEDSELSFDWTFVFTDGGFPDFGFVSVNGTVEILAVGGVNSHVFEGTFKVTVPAGTVVKLGFGVSDAQDDQGSPTLRVDDIKLTTVAKDAIVLDMTGGGLSLRPLSDNVHFDVTGDGLADKTGWVGAGSALLARDTNHNGRIDGASELVSQKFGAGFGSSLEALASLDGNHDGRIDAEDAEYANMLVWRDADGDGVSQAGELQTLVQAGVLSITTTSTASNTTQAGNRILGATTMAMDDGSTHAVAGIAFNAKAASTLPAPVEQGEPSAFARMAAPMAPHTTADSGSGGTDFAALLNAGLGLPQAAPVAPETLAASGLEWMGDVHDPNAHHPQPHDAAAAHPVAHG